MKLTDGNQNVMLASKSGRAVRFEETQVRQMGRSAAGVRGMNINVEEGDRIVGMIVDNPQEEDKALLVISENGFGKRSLVSEFRIIKRGGKGMKSMQVTDKTGQVIAVKNVNETDDLMITTKAGIMIRMKVADIRVMGRATQGVRVIKLGKDDAIADVAVISLDLSLIHI